jgi:hypothetical protein
MINICEKCGSKNKLHVHHITYDPEVTCILCKRCHRVITNINTLIARNYNEKRKLTNEQRIKLNDFFMLNEIWILKSIVAPKLLLLQKPVQGIKPKKKKKRKKNKFQERSFHNWYKPENA